MDIILESILPTIGRILAYIVIEIALNTVCYTTGFLLCKFFTLGRKPKKFISYKSSEKSDNKIIILGLSFWLALFVIYLNT